MAEIAYTSSTFILHITTVIRRLLLLMLVNVTNIRFCILIKVFIYKWCYNHVNEITHVCMATYVAWHLKGHTTDQWDKTITYFVNDILLYGKRLQRRHNINNCLEPVLSYKSPNIILRFTWFEYAAKWFILKWCFLLSKKIEY